MYVSVIICRLHTDHMLPFNLSLVIGYIKFKKLCYTTEFLFLHIHEKAVASPVGFLLELDREYCSNSCFEQGVLGNFWFILCNNMLFLNFLDKLFGKISRDSLFFFNAV